MNNSQRSELKGLIRRAGATRSSAGPSRGLRERVIARSVAARTENDRDSRLGAVLSATALTFLLAMAVWKHVPMVGFTPAMINVSPAVIHWSFPGDGESDGTTDSGSHRESREWRQVRRTTERREEVSQLLVNCFGS